ncbi:MAG TPA: hypothetical protein VIM21_09670 [Gemmatimonadaceae bacterium]
MSVRSYTVLAIASLLSCAPATSSTSAGTGVSGSRGGSTLTAAEIAAVNVSDLYDVIHRIRPNYLRARGNSSVDTTLPGTSVLPNVYLDGQLLGDVSSLHNITASLVKVVHYYDPAQASIRFGTQNRSGVIEVVTQ